METRQVEWVEEPSVKIGKEEYFPGDRTTLSKSEADQYIKAGWCKCTATEEIGERIPGAVAMKVDDVSQNVT